MADRLEAFTVTIPAGTALAAPATIPTSFADGQVIGIEVRVPSGPSGLMGFAFFHSRQQIIPRTLGEWILADNDSLAWPLSDYPTGAAWAVVGYNTDIYDHSVYVRYLINELSTSQPPRITIQPIA